MTEHGTAPNRTTSDRGGRAAPLLLAVVALTGCSGADASLGPGPLGAGREGGDRWEVCAPFNASGQHRLGVDLLSNPGHQDAHLSAVQLLGNENFTLEEALLAPVHDASVGVGEWPGGPVTPYWLDRAVAADRGVVPAGTDGSRNVVLHLSVPVGQSATLHGWRVRYEIGGAPYTIDSTLTFRVRPSC